MPAPSRSQSITLTHANPCHDTSHTRLPPALVRAYLETEYRVHGEGGIVLRCGEYSAALDAMHRRIGVVSSAFVTAWNPYSRLHDRDRNTLAQAALARELELRGLRYLPGVGQHPDHTWPGEESFLVLGIDRDAACELAAGYQQNAFVWCGPGAVPELVLLG
jgi:hypothetical protein